MQYHLHYRQPILGLQPDLDCKCVYGGCVVVFMCVCGDGVSHQ